MNVGMSLKAHSLGKGSKDFMFFILKKHTTLPVSVAIDLLL